MAVSQYATIGESEYTTLRNSVVNILGTPSGSWSSGSVGTTAGYNETITAPSVSPGDKITAAQWNALTNDITAIYTHITNGGAGLTTVNSDNKITAAIYNAMETAQTYNNTNRNTVHPDQLASSTGTTGSLTATWNGSQYHAFRMTFGSTNEKKAFFNAGGKLRFTASGSAGSSTKDLDWRDIANSFGNNEITNLGMTTSGSGSVEVAQSGPTYRGWWYLDGQALNSSVKLFRIDGANIAGNAVYNENFIEVYFRKQSNLIYQFWYQFNDADAGDQQGGFLPGPANDENVTTNMSTSVTLFTPSGAVNVSAPTFSAYNDFNTFSASFP